MTKQQMALVIAINSGIHVVNGCVFRKDGYEYSQRLANGYKMIRIRIQKGNRKMTSVYTHRLVAAQKFGIDALMVDGIQVRHLDNDSTNNSHKNIAIGTAKDNANDKEPVTRMRCAMNASRKIRKLSDEQLIELRMLRNEGWSYSKLMDRFGVTSKGTMSWLCNHEYKTQELGA